MPEERAPYVISAPDGAALAAEAAVLASQLARVIPLRAEHAPAWAAALIRHSYDAGVDVRALTIEDLMRIAPIETEEIAGSWYAVGKIEGAWYAVAPSTATEQTPLVPVIVGHRRRMLKPQDLAGAQSFSTEEAARAAGRKILPRTYAIHLHSIAPL